VPDVICLGEALIDFIPFESGCSLEEVTAFRKAPGGAPANVAAGLSKLGNPSAFLGKVGDDPFGHFLANTFERNGVDVSHMLFDRSALTGLAFVSLSAAGVPEFMFYRNPSADMLLRPDEIRPEFIRSARAFHYGSITLISEPSKSATETAANLAREAGLLISYDPNLRKPLWPSLDHAREQMLAAMAWPQFVKMSEEELEFLSGAADLAEGSGRLMEAYPNIRLMAVTCGADGCYFRSARAEGRIPSFRVEVVDTTGAGDGFVAGTLSGLLGRISRPEEISDLGADDLREVFRFANAVAALTTTKPGAITAIPGREDVEGLLQA